MNYIAVPQMTGLGYEGSFSWGFGGGLMDLFSGFRPGANRIVWSLSRGMNQIQAKWLGPVCRGSVRR